MYLRKLLELSIDQRIEKFADLIGHFKDSLKTEKDIERFALIYPEWALEFQYIDKLKKIIIESKKNTAELIKD